MNFDLVRPCKDCPFRKVGAISLHPRRVPDIVENLLSDDRQWFMCHKTTGKGEYVETEDGEEQYQPTGTESQCAGSMIYLLKVERPSVSMRLAAAVGMLDFGRLAAQFDDIIDQRTS